MALTTSEISHIARLAKLDLEADELQSLGQDLVRVLEYMAVLDDVVVGEGQVVDAGSSRTREDTVAPSLDTKTFLNNAPKTLDHFLLVPAIK